MFIDSNGALGLILLHALTSLRGTVPGTDVKQALGDSNKEHLLLRKVSHFRLLEATVCQASNRAGTHRRHACAFVGQHSREGSENKPETKAQDGFSGWLSPKRKPG